MTEGSIVLRKVEAGADLLGGASERDDDQRRPLQAGDRPQRHVAEQVAGRGLEPQTSISGAPKESLESAPPLVIEGRVLCLASIEVDEIEGLLRFGALDPRMLGQPRKQGR